jgi:hypothetical protein
MITLDILRGLEPDLRAQLPGYDSGILLLIVGSFLITSWGFRSARRMWGNFFTDLMQMGHRHSMSDAERTTAERWVMAAMLLQTFIYEGLLLFSAVTIYGGVKLATFPAVFIAIGLAMLLYVIQAAGYIAVGYAFSNPIDSKSWLRAFSATQSMLGFALILPTLGVLFYPAINRGLMMPAMVLYVLARLLFYIKGFRIFHTNHASIFYFFLYLCTLEIMPVVALHRIAMLISNNL